MRTFACRACGQAVYFGNWRCNQCGATLGFVPGALRLATLEEEADAFRTPLQFHAETPGPADTVPVPSAGAAEGRYREKGVRS